jgi:hypothetical protein
MTGGRGYRLRLPSRHSNNGGQGHCARCGRTGELLRARPPVQLHHALDAALVKEDVAERVPELCGLTSTRRLGRAARSPGRRRWPSPGRVFSATVLALAIACLARLRW